MKISEVVTRTAIYTSDVRPEITTDNEDLSEIIAWADANPVVYKIVMGTKSAPFGRESSTYAGFQRGTSPSSVLARAMVFKDTLEIPDVPASFWLWRARFTFEHYNDKEFKGDNFYQFDGAYRRGCASLDYTPGTLEEVIDRFLAWCGRSYETREVRIGATVVRRLPVAK